MRILLAVDGSEYGKAAADSVAARPWPANSVIKVLSAIEPPYYPTTETWVLPENYYSEMESAAKDQAQTAVKSALETLGANKIAPIEIIGEIKSGAAKEVILDEAKRWDADLVVVGSHGYRALERFLLGSVSNTVASHAPCSVEIVRLKPKP